MKILRDIGHADSLSSKTLCKVAGILNKESGKPFPDFPDSLNLGVWQPRQESNLRHAV